ncbi:MAG: hypothetical protein FWG78_00185 [Coriobacteriia bacterium]|nr:hypothetical protein [Coriobacteriia bacterium]
MNTQEESPTTTMPENAISKKWAATIAVVTFVIGALLMMCSCGFIDSLVRPIPRSTDWVRDEWDPYEFDIDGGRLVLTTVNFTTLDDGMIKINSAFGYYLER